MNAHERAVKLNPLPCPMCACDDFKVVGNTAGGKWVFKCRACGMEWHAGDILNRDCGDAFSNASGIFTGFAGVSAGHELHTD